MFTTYWGLRQSPFGAENAYFYASPSHDEAIARIEYLTAGGRRLGLLVGPTGVGKTLVLDEAQKRLRRLGAQAACCSLLERSPAEVIWDLLAQLGANPGLRWTPIHLWQALADHLNANTWQGLSTLLLLDDVGSAKIETLDCISRICRLSESDGRRLTVVLACQNARLARLPERLLELADLRCDIDAWDLDELTAYLDASADRQGRAAPLFSPAAVSYLHRLTGGLPRRVKQLAEVALAAGAMQRLEEVDVDTLDGAFREISLTPAG